METECGICGRPYGKRRRCYYCNGPKVKTGETRTCKVCGKEFYAARWQLDDTVRNQGTYCSKACKYEALRLDGPGARRRRWDGYIEVYYPTHPDSTKSGWMLEHRLIAEQKYGRRIGKHEHVHHINSVPDDNCPENLEVVDPGLHALISNARKVANRKALLAELAEYRRRYGPLDD